MFCDAQIILLQSPLVVMCQVWVWVCGSLGHNWDGGVERELASLALRPHYQAGDTVGHCGTPTGRPHSVTLGLKYILLLTNKQNVFCKKFLRSLLVLSMLRRMAQGVDSVTTPTAALQSASPQPLQSSLQPHLEQGRYLGLTDRDQQLYWCMI